MKLSDEQVRSIRMLVPHAGPEISTDLLAYLADRIEFYDMLHERDGFVKLNPEERLGVIEDKLTNIKFAGVTLKNPILIASSPLTQSYETIDEYLDQGVAGVVLKSAGDFKIQCKCERERYESGCERKVAIAGWGSTGRVVFSTAQDSKHCERITIEEAQGLYEKIKRHYPEAVVIASFGPEVEEDFEVLGHLPGDIIEITPRYFRKDFQKPLITDWWQGEGPPNPEYEDFTQNRESFEAYHEEVFRILSEQVPKIDRPTLYKFVGLNEVPFPPKHRQDEVPSTGFTIGDSKKMGTYTSNEGLSMYRMDKGSWSGDIVFKDTWANVRAQRENGYKGFISWSGGIFHRDDVLNALFYGADTVQLCSTIYHNGSKVVGEIVKGIS